MDDPKKDEELQSVIPQSVIEYENIDSITEFDDEDTWKEEEEHLHYKERRPEA